MINTLFMIFCLYSLSTSTNIRKQNNGTQNALGVASTCATSFFNSIPPTLCFKRGGDVGKVPTDCPSGYFRHLQLCFENCAAGYRFDGGALCISGCEQGWVERALDCYKEGNIFITKVKKSYFPKSITNFGVTCPQGMYRSGALCYRDCQTRGMVNCGIGMCASSKDYCATGINNMSLDSLQIIGRGLRSVVSFNNNQSATQSVSSALGLMKISRTLVDNAARTAVRNMKNLLNNQDWRKAFLNRAQETIHTSPTLLSSEVEAVEEICEEVHNGLVERILSANESSVSTLQNFNVLQTGEITRTCDLMLRESTRTNCVNSILSSLDNVGSAGLVGLAAAFMQPICDI